MSDYIKKEDAIKAYCHGCGWYEGQCDTDKGFWCENRELLEDIPSADVIDREVIDNIRLAEYEKGLADGIKSAEREHGEWMEKKVVDYEETTIDQWQSARCSVCDRYHTTPYMYYFDDFNFCPNCGADMRKESE